MIPVTTTQPAMTYGKSWFRAERRMTQSWTARQARDAHLKRQSYAVLIEEDDAPQCFAEFCDGCVNVGFYDKLGREALTYQFEEIEPGRLFLSMAIHREFKALSEKVLQGTIFYFRENTSVIIEETNFESATKSSAETNVDLSGNWEPYPAFGDYSSITRRERGVMQA